MRDSSACCILRGLSKNQEVSLADATGNLADDVGIMLFVRRRCSSSAFHEAQPAYESVLPQMYCPLQEL